MSEGLFRRRRLPHWDVENGTYFVTACLAGSIAAQGLLRLRSFREELEGRRIPEGMPAAEWETRKHKMIFARFDEIIDREPAVRHLGDRRAAAIVEKSLRHFNGDRYDLIAFVVMPSHFHWVFHPREEWVQACLRESRVPQGFVGQTSMSARGVTPTSPRAACPIERTARERIMQSIKGYTARECNKLLGLSGTFWQDESYDHVVRDHEELLRIIEYIEHNPVKAGLVLRREDWKYSSACERIRRRIPCGEALPRG